MPLRYLTAGESHGSKLVAILEGLPAGLSLDPEVIDVQLKRRQIGYGAGPRMKLERDRAVILSGVMGGKTIGSPVALEITNINHNRWKEVSIEPFTTPRPGHVDLTAAVKYGYTDLRPGLERASARETAARVAVGAICRHLLAQFSIQIGGYVTSIGKATASLDEISLEKRIQLADESEVRCPSPEGTQLIKETIEQAIRDKDTLGGVIEIVALGLPVGLGSHVHWDRRLESQIGAAVLSVQAIKGVEIGYAFENTHLRGTQAHDAIRLDRDDLVRPTNMAGGLEGGITNGQPLIVRAAMKPIATTLAPQKTVDLFLGKETPTTYERSDFCPVPRAVVVLEAVLAYVLADSLLEKLGGDTISELFDRFQALRKPNLSDLKMDGVPQKFWPDRENF